MTHLRIVTAGSSTDRYGWPTSNDFVNPSAWERARIDDSIVPRADSRDPTTTSQLSSVPGDSRSSSRAISANAEDDVDLRDVTLFIDSLPVYVCSLPGAHDFLVLDGACNFAATGLAPGWHRASSRAVDHVGRVGYSESHRFRVVAAGDPPSVDVSYSPTAPGPGGSILIQATASDPSGIQSLFIQVRGRATKTCVFHSTATGQVCTLPYALAPGELAIRYQAVATDNDTQVGDSGVRTGVFLNTGPDMDSDGLSDAVEAALCTDPANPDTDGDSLKDGWETFGLSFPDGFFTDLPAMGADPCVKDVFLQYDHEAGARVREGVVSDVQAAFRRHGITLHVTENERPRPAGGPNSDHGAVRHSPDIDAAGGDFFEPHLNWTHYYLYSRHRVGRSGTWGRYVTFDIYGGNRGTCSGGDHNGDSCTLQSNCSAGGGTCVGACACPLGTATPETTCDTGGTAPTFCWRESGGRQAIRFMHELGHAIGLGHGGRLGVHWPIVSGDYLYYFGQHEDTNNKPNYRSVMSYGYNAGNTCLIPSISTATSPSFVGDLDYASDALPTLDEGSLDEGPGNPLSTALGSLVCPEAIALGIPVIQYTCRDPRARGLGNDLERRSQAVSNGTSTLALLPQGGTWNLSPAVHAPGIDWSCNGSIEGTPVSSNLNGDGGNYLLPGESCDGTDTNGNGIIDEGCGWSGGEILAGPAGDWDRIPSPPSCLILYDENPGQNCYPQSSAYRSSILGGLTGPDCRPPGLSTATCSGSPAGVPGPQTFNPVPHRDMKSDVEPLPGLELCDGLDNDGDGQVDEGCRDTDGDGVVDAMDLCPETPDTDQADLDADGVGDACDDPLVLALTAQDLGPQGVLLSWSGSTADLRGFNLYRDDPGPGGFQYLGGSYPSTTGFLFADTPGSGGTLQYLVAAVDLNGREGSPSSIGITVPGIDTDGDGIPDYKDSCPNVVNPAQKDQDQDGVGDACDDCILVGDPAQLDTDGDRFGNACDCDFDQSGACNIGDFNLFLPDFAAGKDAGTGTDMDGNGSVSIGDFNLFLPGFSAGAPGPSAP